MYFYLDFTHLIVQLLFRHVTAFIRHCGLLSKYKTHAHTELYVTMAAGEDGNAALLVCTVMKHSSPLLLQPAKKRKKKHDRVWLKSRAEEYVILFFVNE